MKRKTIAKVIDGKINHWINSVQDKGLQKVIRDNVIVTGGCIASMLLSEDVNDYDVYFKTRESLIAVANYYINPIKEDGNIEVDLSQDDRVSVFIRSDGFVEIDSKGKSPYSLIYATSNAITLTEDIQVVVRFYGEPKDIHDNYDFIHCTNYWTHEDGLVLKEPALTSLITKELVYVGSRYPLCSIIRTRKFISRGFTINAGQYLKMCFQISQMDLTDINVLRDQLVGVDSAYFDMLIAALTKKKESNPEFVLTTPYLCEVIDRIF